MTQREIAGYTWLAAASLGFVLVLSPLAIAQSALVPVDQQVYTPTAHERFLQLAQQLETLAVRARDEAKIDERHGGRDDVTDEIEDFAEQARELRQLAFERGVPASKLNDQIRELIDDGRKVQQELAKSKRTSSQTSASWERTLAVLNQLNDQFMAASGLAAPRGSTVGTSGSSSTPGSAGPWADNGQTLLGDLNRRADEAVRLSQDHAALGFTSDIQALRDQVRQFGRQIDQVPPRDAHDRIVHMLADAREVQRRLSSHDVPAALRDNISAMVGTLVQMRDITGDRVQGTSGVFDRDRDDYTAADRDRYSAMDAVQLTTELGARASRAADLAVGADLEDVSSRVARFNDQLREFNSSSPSMDLGERRDHLDNLLRDAQATQRELARRRVSTSLINQWNAVVDLLTRLRDRT